jgi:monovalent cation:H+ antiporter-2, CPA2 family
VDVADVLVEIGAVVLGLAILAPLASRAGVSAIPFYLLLGVTLGEGGLYELRASEAFVETGAQIGVVLLLLMLGLEYSPAELASSVRGSLPAGVVDLVLNAAPGVVAGVLLGFEPLSVVALAGITYISSSSIAAKLLTDLGRLGNRETPTILSVLVLEDLAMAVYLPLLGALLVGISFASASVGVVVAVSVAVGVLTMSARFGPRLSALVFSPDNEQLLLRVLGLTLLVSGVAHRLGVSAAVGAFLVGLGLSGQTADTARQVLAPLRDLFAAVFFFTFGLSVDPRAVLPLLPVALLLGAVAMVSKLATGWWAAARAGIGRRGRMRAGAALAPRGEFSIVIAELAVVAGHTDVGPIATAFVLVTAISGPFLARYADRLVRTTAVPQAST